MISATRLTVLLPLLCTLSLANALPRMEDSTLDDSNAIVTLKSVQRVAISTGADGSTATVFDTTTASADESTTTESEKSTSATSTSTTESASRTTNSATSSGSTSATSSADESSQTDAPSSIPSVAAVITESAKSTASSDIPTTSNTETLNSTSTVSATTSVTSAVSETTAIVSGTSADNSTSTTTDTDSSTSAVTSITSRSASAPTNASSSTITTSASGRTGVNVIQSLDVNKSANRTTSDLKAAQSSTSSGGQSLTANSTTAAGSDSVGNTTSEDDSCTRGARECRDNVMFLCNYITPPPDLSVVKRQLPSGTPQTGNFVVTYDNPIKRKRVGPSYLSFDSRLGEFVVTSKSSKAGYFKVPGTGFYSGGTVQYYDSTAQTWKGLATLKIDAGASGYDMTYIALTMPSTLYGPSASGVLSYLWLAPTSPDTFTPSMFVGNYGG